MFEIFSLKTLRESLKHFQKPEDKTNAHKEAAYQCGAAFGCLLRLQCGPPALGLQLCHHLLPLGPVLLEGRTLLCRGQGQGSKVSLSHIQNNPENEETLTKKQCTLE